MDLVVKVLLLHEIYCKCRNIVLPDFPVIIDSGIKSPVPVCSNSSSCLFGIRIIISPLFIRSYFIIGTANKLVDRISSVFFRRILIVKVKRNTRTNAKTSHPFVEIDIKSKIRLQIGILSFNISVTGQNSQRVILCYRRPSQHIFLRASDHISRDCNRILIRPCFRQRIYKVLCRSIRPCLHLYSSIETNPQSYKVIDGIIYVSSRSNDLVPIGIIGILFQASVCLESYIQKILCILASSGKLCIGPGNCHNIVQELVIKIHIRIKQRIRTIIFGRIIYRRPAYICQSLVIHFRILSGIEILRKPGRNLNSRLDVNAHPILICLASFCLYHEDSVCLDTSEKRLQGSIFKKLYTLYGLRFNIIKGAFHSINHYDRCTTIWCTHKPVV